MEEKNEPLMPKPAPENEPDAVAPVEPAAPKAPEAPVSENAEKSDSGSANAPEPAPQLEPSAPAAPQPQAPAQPAGGQMPFAPGQPAQPQQPVVAPAGGYPPPPSSQGVKSGKAMGALVCGILAIVSPMLIPFVGPVVGIVLGIVAIVLAGKAVREAGHDGKATGGKVCGIIGIVASVLVGALYAFVLATVMSYYASNESLVDYAASEGLLSDTADSSVSGTMDADEQAVYDEATAVFDKMAAKDSALVQEIAAEFEEYFFDMTGMSCVDANVDPLAFADWALTGFSYSVEGAYIDSENPAEATAYVDTSARSVFHLMSEFDDALSAYKVTPEYEAATVDEVKAKTGELFAQAMADTTEKGDYYAAVEFDNQGGTWTVDKDSLDDEIELMFMIF